jgi:hypothetical protein
MPLGMRRTIRMVVCDSDLTDGDHSALLAHQSLTVHRLDASHGRHFFSPDRLSLWLLYLTSDTWAWYLVLATCQSDPRYAPHTQSQVQENCEQSGTPSEEPVG